MIFPCEIPTGENHFPIPIPMGMGIHMGISIPTATLSIHTASGRVV